MNPPYHTHVGVRMYIVCTVYTGEDKKEREETTVRRMPSFVAASTEKYLFEKDLDNVSDKKLHI
jgi:hypothetical protein